MKKKRFIYVISGLMCLFFLAGGAYPGSFSSWAKLIKKYPPPKPTQEERTSLEWAYEQLAKANLQKAFERKNIPENGTETIPLSIPKPGYSKGRITHKRLLPFKSFIHTASVQFDVPEKVIGAVILQESSGIPTAKAPTSSAKGLMQTIDATFKFAKNHLAKANPPIHISNPYKPEDSISAGTWYLSYVFELARQDYPEYNDRKNIKIWKKALEYYYAGPKWGKSPNDVVYAKIGKKTIIIKKAWYANKVLKRAYKL